MTIEFPSTKTTKDAIRDAIGQDVVFIIKGAETACPTCSGLSLLDHSNQTSMDPFCAVCSGTYYLIPLTESTIKSHVRWVTIASESRFAGGDESDFGVAGELITGTLTITIDIDALTEAEIDNIKEVIVDGRRAEVLRHGYRGLPSRDRVRFTAKEYGKE